jgi:uncharacterized DUF497 family protein
MPFEFDSNKSKVNKEKHGIDFNEAQQLWEDYDRLIIPIRNVDEPRFMIIGKIENNIWSAIFTMRNDNVRIISVRRARKEEFTLYES